MKKHFWITLLSLIALCSSACAYPVYRIGMNFQGIDKSAASRTGQKYVYQGNVGPDVFKEERRNDDYEKALLSPQYLVKSMYEDPKYVRLEGPDGNTVWKTSELVTHFPEDFDVDTVPMLDEGVEAVYTVYREGGQNGVLLQDAKTKQRVFKKTDGTEIRLPMIVSEYQYYEFVYDVPEYWLFMKDVDNQTLKIAAVDYTGNLLWNRDTNIMVLSLDRYELNATKNRLIVWIVDRDFETKTLIIDNEGQMVSIKEGYYPISQSTHKAPDYVFLSTSGDDKYICDLRNGEIIAEVVCSDIDMTQVNNSLIAAISYGPFIATIDVLTGELIQDFTPKSITPTETYDITQVKISQDAKDIWYSEKYSQSNIKTKHYRKED